MPHPAITAHHYHRCPPAPGRPLELLALSQPRGPVGLYLVSLGRLWLSFQRTLAYTQGDRANIPSAWPWMGRCDKLGNEEEILCFPV